MSLAFTKKNVWFNPIVRLFDEKNLISRRNVKKIKRNQIDCKNSRIQPPRNAKNVISYNESSENESTQENSDDSEEENDKNNKEENVITQENRENNIYSNKYPSLGMLKRSNTTRSLGRFYTNLIFFFHLPS
jgi:hypothetical protein